MIKWTFETDPNFDKQIKKLDKPVQKRIQTWIDSNLRNCENPRLKGRILCGSKAGQWRYRIGDYRLLCEIKDNKLIILAISIAHRRNAYN